MTGSARRGLFVTGTDTGIGKTAVSALIVTALRRAGMPAGYFKPVQTGTDSDSDEVARLSGARMAQEPGSATPRGALTVSRDTSIAPRDAVSVSGDSGIAPRDAVILARPVYEFALPASPDRAAAAAGASIRPAEIVAAWKALPQRCWVVEGAGGLLVPLSRDATMRDLIAALEIPVLVVASTRLGTINHTLLTLEAARRRSLPVAGLVLNGPADPGLAEVIARFDPAPLIAEVPQLDTTLGEPVSPAAIERAAAELFPAAALRRLFA